MLSRSSMGWMLVVLGLVLVLVLVGLVVVARRSGARSRRPGGSQEVVRWQEKGRSVEEEGLVRGGRTDSSDEEDSSFDLIN